MCVCNLKKKKRKEKKKQPKQRVHAGESELFSFDSIPVHFGWSMQNVQKFLFQSWHWPFNLQSLTQVCQSINQPFSEESWGSECCNTGNSRHPLGMAFSAYDRSFNPSASPSSLPPLCSVGLPASLLPRLPCSLQCILGLSQLLLWNAAMETMGRLYLNMWKWKVVPVNM